MVDPLWAMVSGLSGFALYLCIPFAAPSLPIGMRKRIGDAYLKMAARCLKQFAFVRRILSGYDVIPLAVDLEQKLIKVTLSSSMVGEDKEYRFRDPDDRIKRLWGKPVALNYEDIPAATDAELAELGACVREKETNDGLVKLTQVEEQTEDGTQIVERQEVDPYLYPKSGMQLIDPVDTFELVGNDVDPENIKTCEQLTKERFSKYGFGIDVMASLGVIMGFATGLGGVIAVQYVKQNLIDGGGGGGVPGPIIPIGTVDVSHLIDLVVMLV